MDSSKASTDNQPTRYEGYRPYYSLPWALDPEVRMKYLREDAMTWRRIPPVLSLGHLVKRMQVVVQGCLPSLGGLHHGFGWSRCDILHLG